MIYIINLVICICVLGCIVIFLKRRSLRGKKFLRRNFSLIYEIKFLQKIGFFWIRKIKSSVHSPKKIFLLKSSTFLNRNCRYLHKGISQNCFIFLFFHFSLNKDVTYEIKKKRRFCYFVKLFLQLLPSLLQMMKILIEALSSGYRGREHLSSFLFCSCFCLNFR